MHAPVSPKRPVPIGIYYVILPIWNASIDLSNLTDYIYIYIYLSLSLWLNLWCSIFPNIGETLVAIFPGQFKPDPGAAAPARSPWRSCPRTFRGCGIECMGERHKPFHQLREAKIDSPIRHVRWPNSQPHMWDVLKNMFNSQWHIRLNFCECSASIRHGKGNQKGDDPDPCQVPSTWDALQAQWYQWSPIPIPSVLESEAAVVDAGWPEEDPCPGGHLSQFYSLGASLSDFDQLIGQKDQ